MLPNLSKLSMNIAMPPADDVPKFDVANGTSKEVKKLDILTMFQLFKDGAVFSCINGKISVVKRRESTVFDTLFEFEAGMEKEGEFFAGYWNWGLIIDRSDEEDELGIKDRVLAQVETKESGLNRVDRVFVRISTDKPVYDHVFLMKNQSYENTISHLFQELYTALYAAQNGFGADVYAATAKRVMYEFAGIPRVVYLLECGDGDLDELCSSNIKGGQ